MSKRKNIMDFAGAWKNLSYEEIDYMKKIINNVRKKSTKDLLEKLHN